MEITYASRSAQDLSWSSSSSTNMLPPRPVKIIQLQHPSPSSSSSHKSFLSDAYYKWIAKLRRMTWTEWMETALPCSRWIRTYDWRNYLQVDLMAGTTVGIMLVPQMQTSYHQHKSEGANLLLSLGCKPQAVEKGQNPQG